MNSPDEMAARLTSNVEENEHYVCANLGGKVKRTLGKLSFVREAVAAYYCARDPKTPFRVKAAILAALAYFVMPVDVIPDLIAVLGFTDDATVFWAVYRLFVPHVNDVHWGKVFAYLDVGDPPSIAPMPD
jgi:uncharacterized membrane protein YkvA (DUF1232 family)